MAIDYKFSKASEPEILTHLSICDHNFVPPLSNRVDISDYAIKIFRNAVRFEAWADGNLIGLAAVYCNTQTKDIAFLTNFSVLTRWQRNGIASNLLSNCIIHICDLGFHSIELEVSTKSKAAMDLYIKYGFVKREQLGNTQKMKKNLKRMENE